jgi:hypothetical protein
MRPFRLTTKMMAILTMSLALAAYAPRVAAQTVVIEAPTVSWLCTAAPVAAEGVCVFAAGCCVGYIGGLGGVKVLEYCWPETFVGPKPCPGFGPTNPLPPWQPTTKEGCLFQRTTCIETATEAWVSATANCSAVAAPSSPEWEACMEVANSKYIDDLRKCRDTYLACINRVSPFPATPN